MRFTILLSSLFAASTALQQTPGRPCGLRIAPCPRDQICWPVSPQCTDLNRCRGTCREKRAYAACGGMLNPPHTCQDGEQCIDDPRIKNSCGMACDIPGICVSDEAPVCGGFAGFPCPDGLDCYDYPGDGCDPDEGGADCIGICL
jgi:hypothetical protein